MSTSAVKSVAVHQLSIPLRREVSHAASHRRVSEPIVVSIELNSGVVGYGETLPRPYVTGESNQSVARAIERIYCPLLLEAHPPSFPDALELIDALPWRDGNGQEAPAARAAIELAMLDVYARHFRRPISECVGWMGFSAFGSPGSARTVRHSGVLTAADVPRCVRTLRMLWWYGLTDFKLKVGDAGDRERLRAVAHYLAGSLATGRATLRLDANGAWSLADAVDRLGAWRDVLIESVEQPLAKGDEQSLTDLKSCVHQPLMYDESLVTMADAERLVGLQVADGFNIRISKCGGLLPSLRLAYFARKHGITVQLGCMVGETSILSAAGRRFLEVVPSVRSVEGSFGSFLLLEDIVRRPLRFGYGGRVRPLSDAGLGVEVDAGKLASLSTDSQRFMM